MNSAVEVSMQSTLILSAGVTVGVALSGILGPISTTFASLSDRSGFLDLLRGRPKSVASQASELREREINITPFDCPVITAS
jgi:hypothetical protein